MMVCPYMKDQLDLIFSWKDKDSKMTIPKLVMEPMLKWVKAAYRVIRKVGRDAKKARKKAKKEKEELKKIERELGVKAKK